MKVPTQVKIGTQVFEVVLRNPKEDGMLSDGSYGYTMEGASLIVIDASISKRKQRTTFIHEMLHAIAFTFGSPTKPGKEAEYEDWEHHFIGIYEEALLVVLKENPEVAKYLSA